MKKVDFYKSLGDNINKARLARRLTQQELGDRAGTTRQVISQIESGTPSKFCIDVIWALGLDASLLKATSPENDDLGRSLAYGSLPKRASKPRSSREEDNEFER